MAQTYKHHIRHTPTHTRHTVSEGFAFTHPSQGTHKHTWSNKSQECMGFMGWSDKSRGPPEPRALGVVHAEALTDEFMRQIIECRVKCPDEPARRAHLRAARCDVHRDTFDVPVDTPHAVRLCVEFPVQRGYELEALHAGAGKSVRHRLNVLVDSRRKNRVHLLEHEPSTGMLDEERAVDETVAKRRARVTRQAPRLQRRASTLLEHAHDRVARRRRQAKPMRAIAAESAPVPASLVGATRQAQPLGLGTWSEPSPAPPAEEPPCPVDAVEPATGEPPPTSIDAPLLPPAPP